MRFADKNSASFWAIHFFWNEGLRKALFRAWKSWNFNVWWISGIIFYAGSWGHEPELTGWDMEPCQILWRRKILRLHFKAGIFLVEKPEDTKSVQFTPILLVWLNLQVAGVVNAPKRAWSQAQLLNQVRGYTQTWVEWWMEPRQSEILPDSKMLQPRFLG